MNIISAVNLALSVFFIYATFVSLLRWDNWWVRIFDFPRIQIGVLLLAAITSSFLIYDYTEYWHYLITGALVISLLYQIRKVYKYTFFAPKQVKTYKGDESDNSFSLIVSNVYQPNHNVGLLLELAKKYKPDMILVLEANKWWEDQLKVIEDDYPYSIRKPQENLYGMLLFSKLKLEEEKINYLFMEDIPSFEARVRLNETDRFKLYCLHPRPPFPTESDTSTNRDAELLLVGKEVQKHDEPVLIAGDFNDVAWSNTTRLFQKVSELLDPRIGRGFYNTFHAGYPLLRWSLDHVFHSDHFQLIKLRRLKNIGSDHFPIYIKLQYIPEEKEEQDEPQADRDEMEWAKEKIEKAEGPG